MRSKKHKRPAQPQDGWTLYTAFERCEDCELRDALSITGKPLRDRDPHHRRLRKRGLSHLIDGSPRTVDDCENCGGTGYVRRVRKADPHLDRGWWGE